MAERSPLDLDLRLGHIRSAQRRAQPRLAQNLRQLGAVGPYVPPPPPGSQQAVVHGWFGQPSTTGAHLTYLQKGKGPEARDAALFSRESRPVDALHFVQRGERDPHQFRLSVSLKDQPQHFDFQHYVTLFMRRVERDLGRPLDWVAAVHHDTAHPHAHVVLRGRDRTSEPLYITKDYLSHGMRYQASHIATALLGRVQSPEREPSREQSREPDRTPQHVTGPSLEPGPAEPRRERGRGW